MDQPALVSVMQAAGNLLEQFSSVRQVQGASFEQVAQRAMLHIGHDQVVPRLLLAIIVGGQNMLVVQIAHCLRLAREALSKLRVTATDDLNGNLALYSLVGSQVYLRHTTPPQAALQAIAAKRDPFQSRHGTILTTRLL